MSAGDFAIWWLCQADYGALADSDGSFAATWPEWLLHEFLSASGRNGRGRLWVARQEWPSVVSPWPETPLARRLKSHAGIVIPRELLPLLGQLPGITTDFLLARIWPTPEQP